MTASSNQLVDRLNAHRAKFKAFLAARVGSEAVAEDLIQEGLLKALRHADKISDDGHAVAWFYQVLRNAMVDHFRASSSAQRRHDALGTMLNRLGEDIAAAPRGWETQLCGCLGAIIATLKPPHAELLRRVDLDGEPVKVAAARLNLTVGNANVILHRARKELRRRLERFCGACADNACLDCDCQAQAKTAP